jgi:hypothetical protein
VRDDGMECRGMGIRLTLLWIWKLIDPLFYLCSRLHYIENREQSSIFRVRITKYKGKNLILSDGTRISRNDLLLKIHLHNVRLLNESRKIKNELKRTRLMYRLVLNSMPILASYLKGHPEEENIKGIIGITTINKVVQSLGFECFIPESRWYRFFKKLGQLPIFLLSSSSLKNFQKNKLTYLFLSKDKLYLTFGKNSPVK